MHSPPPNCASSPAPKSARSSATRPPIGFAIGSSRRRPTGTATVEVDLGDDELAVIAALREISPDAEDSTEQQATETLLKSLAADGDGPA